MVVFLTSSPTGPLGVPNDGWLDQKNGFVDNLKKYWKADMRGLIIASSPDRYERNDEMKEFFHRAFSNSGVPVSGFDVWDHRVPEISKEALHQYDVVMLSGGHVPTQNAYFQEISLGDMMREYQGIVIGVSAGTMNSADVVYAQPEEPGEAVDPGYQRFLTGLGLTKIMVLPHYQMVKDSWLDGMRLMEEITYPDSYGRTFLVLVDGSYVLIEGGKAALMGEAYEIAEGVLTQICSDGETVEIDN